MKIASIGQRIFSGLTDLIVTFIFIIGFGLITHTAALANNELEATIRISGWPFFISLCICFLLFAGMEYFTGKTPGKYLAKTKVVTEDYNKVKIWQALMRNMLRFIDGIGLYLVGLIIIIFDKKNQRLGDLLAKTYVIKD